MSRITSIAVAAALAFCAQAQADNHGESKRSFGQIYSDCGIGAKIFAGDTENERLLAMISNITFDWGTTASSSNASSPEQCSRQSHLAAAFIHQNIDQIESDIARGQGEHLAATLDLLGCDADVATPAARAAVEANTDSDRKARSAAIYDTVNANCSA